MKNTNQIRQLLKKALEHAKDTNIKRLDLIDANQTYKWIMQDMFSYIFEALALLPCPTCNGTGKVRPCTPKGKLFGAFAPDIPCPDCSGNEFGNKCTNNCSNKDPKQD